MTKTEFVTWAKERGWEQDKRGHLQKTIAFPGNSILNRTYRFKLSPSHVRYELKADIGNHNEWLRLRGAFFKDLHINEDGKVSGL